jgi:hypothetical protein
MAGYNKMMTILGSALASGETVDLEGQIEKAIFGGASSELEVHLRRAKRTVQEEYELIQQKKSFLSKRMRSYVEYLHSKMQEPKEEGETEA